MNRDENRDDEAASQVDSDRFETACDWFVRLREQPESPELLRTWLDWCRADERNRIAFEEVRELWGVTGVVKAAIAGQATSAAIAGQATSAATAGQAMSAAPLPRASRTRALLLAATVTALAVGLGITTQLMQSDPDVATFTTSPSEHRGFTLSDGSRIELAGDSSVKTIFRDQVRNIELVKGEAYFRVAHDKLRPFIVHANALHVRAIGTSFDVRTSGDRVVVAVEEGSVMVGPRPEERSGAVDSMLSLFRAPSPATNAALRMAPLKLSGGQEVAVGVPTKELQLLPIEPTAVASWREGRLRFAREPLSSVIASVRAATGRDIEVASTEIGALRFTGTVFSSRVDSWVEGLPAIFPVTVHQDGATVTIAPRE